MSKLDLAHQIKLNVISKQDITLRISIIVGSGLTISHLKRKIETQFNELYGIELVVRVIESDKGFIISNNSKVEEHFSTGETIYFSEHEQKQKTSSFNMNLPSNIGQILSTIRFMTGSALQKLDIKLVTKIEIDLTLTNSIQIASELIHLGFWYSNPSIVKRLFKIYNKIFGENTIEKFISEGSEMLVNLMLRNMSFWLVEIPSSYAQNKDIVWELLQLLQKFSCNKNFAQMIKNNKITRTVLEISKNQLVSTEVKKLAVRIVRNVNGGRANQSKGFSKTKSDYIPSLLGNSEVGTHDTQQILALLSSSSQNDKSQALEMMHQANFEPVTESSVRFDYFTKLMGIFTIRKFKSRKHITIFNQILNNILANTPKEKYTEIMQKDILHFVHQFLLEGPVQLHSSAIQFIGRACKYSTNAGTFNIEKGMEVIDSPYLQFQKHVVKSLSSASERIHQISPIRFIPGIRDCIKLSLKTKNQEISFQLLKILGNLTLDQQCRYQIINLKGIQVFVKFLETSISPQICRTCSKSLLNIAISSRENKAKVLSSMNTILQIFYQGKYDSVTFGYIETILKSKNI